LSIKIIFIDKIALINKYKSRKRTSRAGQKAYLFACLTVALAKERNGAFQW